MSGDGSEKKEGRSELVARVAAGDSRAQQELVRHLQRRVRMIALAILGNAHDADDATQVIMMEVLRSARSFRGESLLGWADRIAARTAARHARQRRAFALQGRAQMRRSIRRDRVARGR